MVFICLQRWQRRGHVDQGPMALDALWSYAGFTGVWHTLLSFVTDSALEDFVLMHCVFIPNGQLCPVLTAQYPFSTALPNVVKCCFPPLWKKPLPTLLYLHCFWSLTAVHLPCAGLAGLWTGEAGLHTQQQAQGDPPGDAVGCSTWRSPAGGGRLGGLPRGQPIDISNNKTAVITADVDTV